MSAHTPGPWSVHPGHYPGFLEIKGASFKISVVTSATDLDFGDYCSRTADAQLIAAAPDLFEALKALVSSIDNLLPREGQGPLYVAARAAIARATGEQS